MNHPVAWYTIGYMKILYSTEQVEQRIKEMAREIITQYANEKPLFVCLLRGAVPFTSQLMMNIAREDPSFHPEVIYMHASAYGAGREAQETTVYSSVDSETVANRAVIVLDDCLDRGVTYTKMKTLLLENGASSVGLIVLVNKDTVRSNVDTPLLVGFTTPDVWLVGMGMDDADTATEARRWDGYIGKVS